MEYFFKRLEAYIKVRPTSAMIDIIVKIMVEVISILGIVTKEIRQGRTSMRFRVPIDIFLKLDLHTERYLKKLLGRKDVEDALQRLDKLTQEEARMAATETLTVTRGIDDNVKDVDERVRSVDMKVEGIDDRVMSVDSRVQGVDHKVGSVIQGELYFSFIGPRIGPQPFTPRGVMETGVAVQQVFNQVNDLNRS
jgi:hypothetical protein